MQLTKKTVIKWASHSDIVGNTDFVTERRNKINEMVESGKTDGIVVVDYTEFTGEMNFINESSAEEWINFVKSLADTYKKIIVSTEIKTI